MDREEELLKATQEMFKQALKRVKEQLQKNPQDTYLLKRKEALEKALGRIEKKITPPVLKVKNNLMTHSQGMLINNAKRKEEQYPIGRYDSIRRDYIAGILELRHEDEKNKFTIAMPLEITTQKGAGMLKIFEFLLHKATTLPPQNPTFEMPFSEFRELVGLKNRHTEDIKEDLMQLSKTHISVEMLFGKTDWFTREIAGGGMFTFFLVLKGNDIEKAKGKITIAVSPLLFKLRGLTFLPSFAYTLKANAFSLIVYIADILAFDGANKGFEQDFKISFKPVAEHLGLPTNEKGKNFINLVATPLLEAIEEINNHPENYHIVLEPVYKTKWKILDGDLRVHLKNGYLQHFLGKRENSQEDPQGNPS